MTTKWGALRRGQSAKPKLLLGSGGLRGRYSFVALCVPSKVKCEGKQEGVVILTMPLPPDGCKGSPSLISASILRPPNAEQDASSSLPRLCRKPHAGGLLARCRCSDPCVCRCLLAVCAARLDHVVIVAVCAVRKARGQREAPWFPPPGRWAKHRRAAPSSSGKGGRTVELTLARHGCRRQRAGHGLLAGARGAGPAAAVAAARGRLVGEGRGPARVLLLGVVRVVVRRAVLVGVVEGVAHGRPGVAGAVARGRRRGGLLLCWWLLMLGA